MSLKGVVVSGHGRHYMVESPDGVRRLCHPRGKKSAAVVGDRVVWAITGDEGVIESIEPRRNLLFRQDDWKTKSFAANLDGLLMWVAVEPVFSESQLTRALIAADAAGIEATIVLNKIDLPGADAARERLAPYVAMGYRVVTLSLGQDRAAALNALQPLLASRTTLVLGPSGSGKSTLINALIPDAKAQVGEISQALNSGRHTTTHTQWYWLDGSRSTALIDSPGFQEFGLRQLEATQLAECMPDLRPHAGGCKFYNCTHLHEPGCAVIAAGQRGDISATRLRIYGELFKELSASRH